MATFLPFFRDKLTSDDCIGTHYLPMSEISGQGEEGWCTVYKNYKSFFFHAQVSQAYWDPDVYRYRVEMVIPSSLKTITTTATTIAVTAAAAVCNDNF